ncbi:MAG: chemotaxis protein CheR [Candidatus Aminicenantes bacterium]|nr:chemotaxis protein CheR [Candidatus Aminicenantes bacterium]
MISELLLSDFTRALAEHTGLNFTRDKWPQLQKGLEEAAGEFGFNDPAECIRWLMSADLSRGQVEILASYLTVGETYFFREPKSFAALETFILPGLIRARREGEKRLRLWSAACSSGEEAYSLAMIIDRKKEELKDFNILILATDINCKALKKARDGIYGEWSFRDNSQWIKDRYFTREAQNRYQILPHLREMVTFDYLNLAVDACPSLLNNTNAMDIIFCRNVLMYFGPTAAKRVVERLSRCLAPDGCLVVSPTDAFNVTDPTLSAMDDFPDAPVYRKAPVDGEPTDVTPVFTAAAPVAAASVVAPGPAKLFEPPPPWVSRGGELKNKTGRSKGKTAPLAYRSYREALGYYNQGLYMKAVELLESLPLSPPPTAPQAAAAEACDYTEDRVYELLARAHANQGKLEAAEQYCLKAIAAAKFNPQYRCLLATIQLELGNTGAAVASLKQSLYLDPDFIPAHFTLAHIARQKQDYTGANRYFDNCLSLLNNLDPAAPVLEMEEWLTAERLGEVIKILKEKGAAHG